VPRLLLLCRHPHHVPHEEAQAWLRRELQAVLDSEALRAATLTRLGPASGQWGSSFDWLVEFQLDAGFGWSALERGGGLRDLMGDLRLLGMAPAVLLADERSAVELRRS
jgi:hypothetical protein